MDDAVIVSEGEGCTLRLRWTDQGGPIDITGRTISIVDASHEGLFAASCSVFNGPLGEARIVISSTIASFMRSGRVNWVRVGMALPDGDIDTTPKIWIAVQ